METTPLANHGEPRHDAEHLREIERTRLRALAGADLTVADQLHADDFQLVNPAGGVLTKAQYLDGIASGFLNYRLWEPDGAIDVRLHDGVALIRYRSHLHMSVDGADGDTRSYWHTDTYEYRDGRWQIVWSHATQIQQS